MKKAKKNIYDVVKGHIPETTQVTTEGYVYTERFKTGIEGMDEILDGGLPRGRIVSLAAEEGGGKTTMAIQMAGNIIEAYDKYVYYFDVEGGASAELIYSMGYGEHLFHPETNPDGKLIVLDTPTIQDISRIFRLVAQDPDTGLMIIDSTTATLDGRDLDDETLGMDNRAQARHARMWSEAHRPFNAIMKKSQASLLLIHQARDNLANFIVRTEAARGRALKHITSVEIFGTIGRFIDENGDEQKGRDGAAGAVIRLTTTKNRLTAPYAKVQLPLFYGKGISNMWSYREWLETVYAEDLETGELITNDKGEPVKILDIRGGGHATLTLPSGVFRVRGKAEIDAVVRDNIEDILDLIEKRGGLRLEKHLPPEEDITSNVASAFR